MLTKQEKFLLRTLTGPFNQETIDCLDLKLFYKLINNYKLSPLLYSRLSENGFTGLPPDILKELKKNYLLNLQIYLIQKKETLRIIQIFNKERIPVIVFKGSLLGEKIYGKEGVRNASSDIDLLIKYQDLPITEKLLNNAGYEVKRHNHKSLDYYDPEISCRNSSGGFMIDLHWNCVQTQEVDLPVTLYWENCVCIDIEGVKVNFLSDEILFIYLSMVLCREITDNIALPRRLLDFHYFMLRYKDSLNYEYLKGIISDYNLKLCILFCFSIANEGFGENYNMEKIFLDSPIISNLKSRVFNRMINSDLIPKKSYFLKRKMILTYVFSKGSILGMLRFLWRNYKYNCFKFFERQDIGFSPGSLVRHFLLQLKKVTKKT